MLMKRLLFLKREFILILALVLGLAASELTRYTEPLVLPVLGVVMTLSIMMISGQELRSIQKLIAPLLWGMVMNYLVLSGVILSTSALIIRDPDFWTGFVILASVPPAVAVIPFTDFLGGNLSYALIGTMGAYLAGLILMPVVAGIFWDRLFSNRRVFYLSSFH